jgi:fibronectin-binding autotransporter adhesin
MGSIPTLKFGRGCIVKAKPMCAPQGRQVGLALILMLMFAVAEAGEIHVPQDAPGVQSAIDQAAPGDVIVLAPGVYYERIHIEKDGLSIRAAADTDEATSNTIMDGGAGGSVIALTGAKGVTIEHLTIRNGKSENGGGIATSGSNITLENCTIMNNQAQGRNGYHIADYKLTPTEGRGAGLFCFESTATLNRCKFSDNHTTGGRGLGIQAKDGKGGGIYIEQTSIDLTYCELSGNSALGGYCELYDSLYSVGAQGFGGGIYAINSSIHLDASRIVANIVQGGQQRGWGAWGGYANGGALYASKSHLLMSESYIAANQALGNLGSPSPYREEVWSGGHGNAWGGGVHLDTMDGTITSCSIIDNEAIGYIQTTRSIPEVNQGKGRGAGIYNNASNILLENDTLSGNQSNTDSGAIFSKDSTVGSLNNTIAYNDAPQVSGVHAEGSGVITIRNTLLAHANQNMDGNIASQGHNLLNQPDPAHALPTDIVATDPWILPLAEARNGTWIHPLDRDSPAIDAGDAIEAPAEDQRGVARPQGFGIDIGAYEYDGVVKDLRLIAPNETKLYLENEPFTLTWVSNVDQAGTAIQVELWRNGAHIVDLGYDWNQAGAGSKVFAIPSVDHGSGYRLLIRSTWNRALFDASVISFAIGNFSSVADHYWACYR